MSDLYNRLKTLCEERNVKPATMCRELGLNPNIPTEIKSGRKKGFSAETANKIANYFGVSVSYLLGQSEEKSPSTDELSEVKKKILDRLNRMSDQEVQKVIELLDVLDPMFK